MQVPCWGREELQDVLSDALSQPWSVQEEAVLGNELGMETVIDAVGRVNSLVKVCLPFTQLAQMLHMQRPIIDAASMTSSSGSNIFEGNWKM